MEKILEGDQTEKRDTETELCWRPEGLNLCGK